MKRIENMNSAMQYIEENLAGEISYDEIARRADCSTYHLQRMFPYIADVPLSEYIRRRRMTLAATELQAGGAKVIDLALKYGYESPEAFSRAFKSVHGILPTEARAAGKALKSYPPMTFHISVRGDKQMKYRIMKREAFKVFGIYAEISTDMETAFKQVPEFFKKCDEDQVPDEINALLGRFHDNHTMSALYDHTENTVKYMLCNFLPDGLEIPDKFTVLEVPALTWVVFDVVDGNVQGLLRRIWSEWFPTSGYEAVPGVQFEMYYGLASHENIHAEVWIPIKA